MDHIPRAGPSNTPSNHALRSPPSAPRDQPGAMPTRGQPALLGADRPHTRTAVIPDAARLHQGPHRRSGHPPLTHHGRPSPPEDPCASGDDPPKLCWPPNGRGRFPRGRRRPSAPHDHPGGAEDPCADGDDVTYDAPPTATIGRSPRGRGRLRRRVVLGEIERKIPARAGTTGARAPTRVIPREDPRAGGDDLSVGVQVPVVGGRSPRGRGRRNGHRRVGYRRRKIPARTGTTPSGPSRS